MHKLLNLLLLTIFISTQSISQAEYLTYEWSDIDDNFTQSINTPIDKKIVKEKYIVEHIFEGEEFWEYELVHKIIYVGTEKGVESNNKVYLPLTSSNQLIKTEARVYDENGIISTMNESDILEATDEESGVTYKYFALKGLTKNKHVEYYYILKNGVAHDGVQYIVEDDTPKEKFEFDFYGPSHLLYAFKSYNGLQNFEQDTTVSDKNVWRLKLKDVEALPILKEEIADAYKKSFVYKLDKNLYQGTSNIVSYNNAANIIHKRYFDVEIDRKTKKEIDKLSKKANITSELSDEEKIRNIEEYIKKNIFINNNLRSFDTDIRETIKSGTANKGGLIKMFLTVLKYNDIETQIVLTSQRQKSHFDADFETYNNLTHYLFYFPKLKLFLNPTDIESRLGLPTPSLTANYGLFVKELNIGSVKSGVGKVEYIPSNPASDSYNKMFFDVSFDDEMTKIKAHVIQELMGHKSFIQPINHLINNEVRENMFEFITKSINENVEVTNLKVENNKSELYGIKPVTFDYNIETDLLLTKANDKILFNVGELIGPQVELYEQDLKEYPVELDYRKEYIREIKITLPEGYKVVNSDDVIIKHELIIDDKVVMNFNSDFELDNNTLTIFANEIYDLITIPVENLEDYRKVINSAADFNKVVLILQKQ